jgi:glycosyltransferase involved in cell wall biosynthesis
MERIKTALLYDPYVDTLGGGERYVLTIAEILLKNNWQVVLAWSDESIIKNAKQRFSLDLANLFCSKEHYDLLSSSNTVITRQKSLSQFDLTFIVSDGSIPLMFGKKKLLHYQVPFTKVNRSTLVNRIKLLSIDRLIINSKFTESVIRKTLKTNKTTVLYPPIDTSSFTPGKKKKIILGVGRFASPSHSKRQDILINAFKKLVDSGLKDWKLILAGGQKGSDTQLNKFKELSKGYPVDFMINPNFQKLQKLYAEATFFWHAAGFEVDENLNPEAVEHFGITTVEAMSAGCVPVVINKGGQKEIITSQSGRLWNSVNELIATTKKIIKDPTLTKKLSRGAINRSQHFSEQNFSQQLLDIIA